MGKVIQLKPAYRTDGFAPLPGQTLASHWGHASQYMLYWDCSIEGSREAGYTLYDRYYADGLTHNEIIVREHRATDGRSLYEALCETHLFAEAYSEAFLAGLREFDPVLAEEVAALLAS